MARKLQLIGNILAGELDPEKVKQLIDEYLLENPPKTNITINGVGPDENGNFVIQTNPDPGTSDPEDNVVEFDNAGNQPPSGSDTEESNNVVEF